MSFSFSSSFRLFFPNSLPIFKPLTLSSFPLKPFKNLSLIKPITIQSIPTTQSYNSSQSSSSTNNNNNNNINNTLQPIEQLPKNLQQIINLFQSVQDPRAKYEQLLFYGKNLKPLQPHFKIDDNKVRGCVSQVWLRAYFDSDNNNNNVIFEADSDSVLTKGLAALLVNGLSGHTVEEILRVSPDFVVLLGLQQSLTPSRNNGFLNMLKLMQKKAFALFVEAEKGVEVVQDSVEKGDLGSTFDDPIEDSNINNDDHDDDNDDDGGGGDDVDDGVLGSRGLRIVEILKRALEPIELEVKDVSDQHSGHAGVRGSNDGETHFELKVVSKEFEGKSVVKRHRLVYSLLGDELQSGLHALSIDAKTPSEIGCK